MSRRAALRTALVSALAAVALPIAMLSPAVAADDDVTAPASRTAPDALGTFHPVDPVRVVDTRSGLGGRHDVIGGRATASFSLTSVVPSSASAVLVNVTVTDTKASGYLTVNAAGTKRPTASTLNFAKGATVADLALSALGHGSTTSGGRTITNTGRIAVYNGSGKPVNVLLDIAGWYDDRTPLTSTSVAPGSRYVPLAAPVRVSDRTLAVRADRSVALAGRNGIPVGATGVALNVTMDRPSRSSYVTLWGGGARPRVSSVNTAANGTRANLAVVKLSAAGSLMESINDGSSRVVLDVVGYYEPAATNDGGRLTTLNPARLLDTRTVRGGHHARVKAGETVNVQVAGRGGVPSGQVLAVVVTITAVGPHSSGHLTAWPTGTALPGTSTVNFARGATTPNSTVLPLGKGKISLRSNTGPLDVIVDVTGWYATVPTVSAPAVPATESYPPGFSGTTAVAASAGTSLLRTRGTLSDRAVRTALAKATTAVLPKRASTARAATPLAGVAQPDFTSWKSGYLPSSLYTGAVGQLLFFDSPDGGDTITDGPVLCSGAVVGQQTILTAAHCIYDDADNTWQYGVFFPGLEGGKEKPTDGAYWEIFGFETDHVYETANPKEPSSPYYAADYATLVAYPNSGVKLGQTVAPLPVVADAPAGTKVSLGYPASNGSFAQHCTVEDCYQWFCQSPTGAYLQYAPGWSEVAFGCPTGPGNSGGPIVQNVNGVWSVVSVVSNGVFPNDGCDDSVRTDCAVSVNLWGPRLNSFTTALIARSEAAATST